ncbi:MAG: hypothetical protein ABIP90_05545 [Vicinamibacterales bacterium]
MIRWPRIGEVGAVAALLASGIAFLIKTPYLSLGFNSLFGALFLAAVYGLVSRCFNLQIPLGLLGLVFAALQVDTLGNYFHLYGTQVGPIRYDEFAHLLVQALAAPIVVWLAVRSFATAGYHLPLGVVSLLAAQAMFSVSAFYEVLELWDEVAFGGQRIWSLHDTAEDLQWDLCGILIGVLLANVVLRHQVRSGEPRHLG